MSNQFATYIKIKKFISGIITLLLTGTLIIFAGLCKAQSSGSQNEFVEIIPSTKPEFPDGFDTFAPKQDKETTSTNNPQIAEWTRTAGPGESLIITGENFEPGMKFKVFGQTKPNNATTIDCKVLKVEDRKAVISLPLSLPAWSLYLVWGENSEGSSVPVEINKTEAFWLGPNRSSQNQIVSVFGKNLTHRNDTFQSWIYLKSIEKGDGRWVKTVRANPYRVQFVIPEDIANGVYEAWVHNGHGGNFGWSRSVENLIVEEALNYEVKEFNVKDYGASGDGFKNDCFAIRSTIVAVTRHPGVATVFFPAGNYRIDNTIAVPSNICFKGEGENKTVLKASENASFLFDVSNTENVKFTNLCLDMTGVPDTIPHLSNRGAILPVNMTNFRMQHVKVLGSPKESPISPGWDWNKNSSTYGSPLQAVSGKNIFFDDCEFYGNGIMMQDFEQLFFSNCRFFTASESGMTLHVLGGRNLMVDNCIARDYSDKPHEHSSRFFVAQLHCEALVNTYIANNKVHDFGPHKGEGDQNGGEIILYEDGTSKFNGFAKSADKNHISFDMGGKKLRFIGEHGRPSNSLIAFIANGKGLGQSREIVAVDSLTNSITVFPDWNVIPDESSKIHVLREGYNQVIYNNYLDGEDDYKTAKTANVGIQTYWSVGNMIIDNNEIQNVLNGVVFFIQNNARGGFGPSSFNLIVNNKIHDCRQGVAIQFSSSLPKLGNKDATFLGNVFRNNEIHNILYNGVAYFARENAKIKLRASNDLDFNIYEKNYLYNLPVGFALKGFIDSSTGYSPTFKTLFLNNHLNRGTANYDGSAAVVLGDGNHKEYFVGNIYKGFEKEHK